MSAITEVIQTNISVIFTEEDQKTTFRYLDESCSHKPITHSKQGVTLPGKLNNFELAVGINLIVFRVESGVVDVKIGDTTANEQTGVQLFAYDGDSTNIFISNPGNDPVRLSVVTAKYNLS